MLAIVGDLVSTAEQSSFPVFSDKWTNAARTRSVRGQGRGGQRSAIERVLTRPVRLCPGCLRPTRSACTRRHGRPISKFDTVVFQAPFSALEGYDFVDLLQQLCNRGFVLEQHGEDDANLGKRVSPNCEAQSKPVLLHLMWRLTKDGGMVG